MNNATEWKKCRVSDILPFIDIIAHQTKRNPKLGSHFSECEKILTNSIKYN